MTRSYLIEVLKDACCLVEEWSCRAPVAHIANEAEHSAEQLRSIIARLEKGEFVTDPDSIVERMSEIWKDKE